MRHTQPTTEQVDAYAAWLKTRPTALVAEITRYKLDPWTLYRIKSGHRVYILSFGEHEDGTFTAKVGISGKYNAVGFERNVFGVPLDELIECELPLPGEVVGDGGVTVEELKLPAAERDGAIQRKVEEFCIKKGRGDVMSYDWRLVATVDNNEVTVDEGSNFTWNILPMFYKAMGNEGVRSFSEYNGRPAKEMLVLFERGVTAMTNDAEAYKKLNPANGWGNYDIALKNMIHMRDTCAKFPSGTFVIH